MKFELNSIQQKKLEQWLKKKPQKQAMRNGASLTYCFTVTGIGTVIRVQCEEPAREANLTEIDLTDYGSW